MGWGECGYTIYCPVPHPSPFFSLCHAGLAVGCGLWAVGSGPLLKTTHIFRAVLYHHLFVSWQQLPPLTHPGSGDICLPALTSSRVLSLLADPVYSKHCLQLCMWSLSSITQFKHVIYFFLVPWLIQGLTSFPSSLVSPSMFVS